MVEYQDLVISIQLHLWDVPTEDEPLLEGLCVVENDVFVFLQDLKNKFHVVQICLEWRLLLIFNT